jgi:hypothetical protein
VVLREAAKEQWAQEGFLHENPQQCLALNGAAIERCHLLGVLQELDYSDLADVLRYDQKEMKNE